MERREVAACKCEITLKQSLWSRISMGNMVSFQD